MRERIRGQDTAFSLRKVAQRVGIEPAYLSKIERDQTPPPSEATIRRLAIDLREDPDLLLAMAGKVSSDLRAVILRRPQLFADLLRQLKGCTGPRDSARHSRGARRRMVATNGHKRTNRWRIKQ